MDTAVALVQSYLYMNGYFTVTEYPVLELMADGEYRTVTDGSGRFNLTNMKVGGPYEVRVEMTGLEPGSVPRGFSEGRRSAAVRARRAHPPRRGAALPRRRGVGRAADERQPPGFLGRRQGLRAAGGPGADRVPRRPALDRDQDCDCREARHAGGPRE